MSIVCKVSWSVNQRFNSFFVVSVYHPAFNIVTWTPFCLNVLDCLECLCCNDHQMRKRFLIQMVCGWINKNKHPFLMFLFFVWYHWINSGNFYGAKIRHAIFSRGRHSLIWPMRVCAAEQGMVFKVLSLNRVYNFTIERLELGVFLDWKPFKECEDLRWAVYICKTNNFFLNIYLYKCEKLLNSVCKTNKSGSESSVSCPKHGSEMSNFCLKQGRGLKASAAHLFPKFAWVAPRGFFWRLILVRGFFRVGWSPRDVISNRLQFVPKRLRIETTRKPDIMCQQEKYRLSKQIKSFFCFKFK